ncbi:MAG TPA: SPOR domain-containing protein, partial [Azospirillaceae bacterium]|nr:SPOR domain-containing protein [Azospirillaceae bacterium]
PTPPKPAPTPTPATPAGKTAAPVGGAGGWAVQVGTFSVSANADQLARRLSQNSRQAYVVDWQDRQGRTWKAVRVGNFANEAAARAAAAQLKSEMSLSGQVIDLR